MLGGGFGVYQKNVFSKECKIHFFFVAVSWVIFVPKVEQRAHNKARTEPKPSEPGV